MSFFTANEKGIGTFFYYVTTLIFRYLKNR